MQKDKERMRKSGQNEIAKDWQSTVVAMLEIRRPKGMGSQDKRWISFCEMVVSYVVKELGSVLTTHTPREKLEALYVLLAMSELDGLRKKIGIEKR